MAGRGWGKTRTGAEWVRAEEAAGARRFALVGRTAADVRDVMVEGESGLLAISPPWNRPTWVPSKRRLTWPSGAIATTYSADKPDQLRGPQHDRAWCDELAAWRYPEAWANLQMGLRLGDRPRACVTTTPRPTKIIKQLRDDSSTRLSTGTTYDNAGNLPRAFIDAILRRYEGTRIGLQELLARVLDDTPGALWTRALIEASRLTAKQAPKPADLRRIVVAVDPQTADPTKRREDEEQGCETGIVIVGLGALDKAYVLEDLSGQYAPAEWAERVADAYALWKADLIVAEANNGGALVEANLRGHEKGRHLPVKLVHASRGKRARAEPVSTLYEQKRVLHVGAFAELEDQLCTWDASSGAASPDRLDALVWGVTELMLGEFCDSAPDDPVDVFDDRF